MKPGTKVSWVLKNGNKGHGVTISEEDKHGKVVVATHFINGVEYEEAFVIHCNMTWLTEVQETQ